MLALRLVDVVEEGKGAMRQHYLASRSTRLAA